MDMPEAHLFAVRVVFGTQVGERNRVIAVPVAFQPAGMDRRAGDEDDGAVSVFIAPVLAEHVDDLVAGFQF